MSKNKKYKPIFSYTVMGCVGCIVIYMSCIDMESASPV